MNDVVLDLGSGGLRQLMLHHGDPTAGVELIANIPVPLPSSGEPRMVGNELGFKAVQLPVWESDAQRRLALIASTNRFRWW